MLFQMSTCQFQVYQLECEGELFNPICDAMLHALSLLVFTVTLGCSQEYPCFVHFMDSTDEN